MRKKTEITPLNKADAEFFHDFFEEYHKNIYHAASSYTTTPADRDDLVQEAVIRLMKNISALRQLTRCKTVYYIVMTVRTAYIDMLRSKQDICLVPLNNDDDLLNVLSGNIPADHSETDIHLRMAVKRLKETLTEKDWIVLVGKVIMGYTHEDLGKLLNMNPASVRMALSRAKANAKEILQSEDWMGGD